MTYKELLYGIEYKGEAPEGAACLVTQDSRKVLPGAVFVCIKGANSDGHVFAKKALEKGAGMIVSQNRLGLEKEIVVKDTRAALSALCQNYFGRPAHKLVLIGVTGTNGKTTVSNLIKQLLQASGKKCGLIGTNGNEIDGLFIPAKFTTPEPWDLNALFARMLKAGCSHVVMEASSQALHQERLSGLNFKLGVFCNLSRDHLDYHGNMESYFESKKKLFQQCDIILVNADDSRGQRLALEFKEKSLKTFSANKGTEADYKADDISLSASEAAFNFIMPSQEGKVKFPMPGAYSVYNALAAGASAEILGCNADHVIKELSNVKSIKGRCEVLYKGAGTVICDFAHTDDALEKVLGALRPFAKKRLLVVFGCPGNRDRDKRPKMAAAVAKHADVIYVSSDNPRSENPVTIINDVLPGLENTGKVVYVEPDREKAVKSALDALQTGDMLVLCGKGHEDYQALDGYTIYFSEHRLVEEYFCESGVSR